MTEQELTALVLDARNFSNAALAKAQETQTECQKDINAIGQKHERQLHDISRIADRIPEKLNETLITLGLHVDQLIKDFETLNHSIESGFVKRTEFEVMRVEHEQMKKLMWGGITLILTLIVTALIGMVVAKNGGGLPLK